MTASDQPFRPTHYLLTVVFGRGPLETFDALRERLAGAANDEKTAAPRLRQDPREQQR